MGGRSDGLGIPGLHHLRQHHLAALAALRLPDWVRDYIVLVCIVTVLAGWVVISFYFISKPIKQLGRGGQCRQSQLSRPSEEPIQLPDSLEDISIQLNLAREQALRDARAAREAEQRKTT